MFKQISVFDFLGYYTTLYSSEIMYCCISNGFFILHKNLTTGSPFETVLNVKE